MVVNNNLTKLRVTRSQKSVTLNNSNRDNAEFDLKKFTVPITDTTSAWFWKFVPKQKKKRNEMSEYPQAG